MNTTQTAFVCAAVLAAGGVGLGVVALRKLGRLCSWERYSFRATVEFKPSVPKAALNGHAPARAPERHAERPAMAAVPQDGDLTRREAAAVLGVAENTLRHNESAWGIEHSGRTGPHGAVMVTAESVSRHLASRDGSTT